MNQDIEASVVLAGLSAAVGTGSLKHGRDSPDAAGGTVAPPKKIRQQEPAAPVRRRVEEEEGEQRGTLQPYPFFYYTDHSQDDDPDSLTPLTPPGRVPNFPAKMHAIMSRPDLQDVICWMDHGRSWKVLKPREFEIRVIPTYFEHSKFSSFIRQANGWGFRRITTGRDRNSYYHPLFLRSLPHLCKKMKRPGVSKKLAADPEHEPDLYKISELHPVPVKAVDEAILLPCTLQGGPKARMPIYSGILGNVNVANTATMTMDASDGSKVPAVSAAVKLTPLDQEALTAFSTSLGQFNTQTTPGATAKMAAPEAKKPAPGLTAPAMSTMPFMMSPFMMPPAMAAFAPPMTPAFSPMGTQNQTLSALAAANQMAFGNPLMQQANAASQFAAGFAAAAAINQQQMKSMLQSMQTAAAKPDDSAKEKKTS